MAPGNAQLAEATDGRCSGPVADVGPAIRRAGRDARRDLFGPCGPRLGVLGCIFGDPAQPLIKRPLHGRRELPQRPAQLWQAGNVEPEFGHYGAVSVVRYSTVMAPDPAS